VNRERSSTSAGGWQEKFGYATRGIGTGFSQEEVEGVAIPVARLRHIVQSKTLLGRDKDRLFLATHADALERLFPTDD